jgi:nucleotide-binding universal stress UspA family protein
MSVAPGLHREIVLGIDYSPASEQALALALELADQPGARLNVLNVGEGYGPPRLPDDLAEQSKQTFLRETLHTLEQWLAARVGERASAVRVAVDTGDPAERLLVLAEAVQADLIVLGMHGEAELELLKLGSVAERVMRNAHCATLIVPSAPTKAPA